MMPLVFAITVAAAYACMPVLVSTFRSDIDVAPCVTFIFRLLLAVVGTTAYLL